MATSNAAAPETCPSAPGQLLTEVVAVCAHYYVSVGRQVCSTIAGCADPAAKGVADDCARDAAVKG